MIAEPQPTPYDLSFRLARFPVRVHPLFWLVTLVMGSTALRSEHPVAFLLIWVAIVFASILVHEFGHAVAFRAFGAPARVWLYWFGGLAVSDRPPRRPGQRIGVSLAGPAAGFVLAGLVYASDVAFRWRASSPYTEELVDQLLFVNLAWGFVNLLPVWPLDGGQVCREVCRMAGVRRPDETALKVSVVAALVVVAIALTIKLAPPGELLDVLPEWVVRSDKVYIAVMFGFLAYGSYQALQMASRQSVTWDDGGDSPPWRRR